MLFRSDKDLYFLMLPLDSRLRVEYDGIFAKTGLARIAAEAALTEKMEPGEIQANIMVGLNHEEAAFDAVRGFAASKVAGALVLSAGVNLSVFEEIAKCKDFYRTGTRPPKKKIILKVSDYRSALVQGRYLAKKGLEVYEYRIESGVNCGGHAFFESKKLLLDVVREFVEKRKELFETTCSMIAKFADSCDAGDNDATVLVQGILPPPSPARITAQGGLCAPEDIAQVLSFGIDGVGVGTPFLLVPQATSVDKETRRLLASAKPEDVCISHASPLGIPFVNLQTSTAARICEQKIQEYFAPESEKSGSPELKPGFPCRQHYLCQNIPGFDHPVCMASREYVMHRLAEIDALEKEDLEACKMHPYNADVEQPQPVVHEKISQEFDSLESSIRRKYDKLRRVTLSRECICRFLGNAGREEIREKSPSLHYQPECVAVARGSQPARTREPVTICPNPDIGYFDREYTLLEMMQHLYGTGKRLTPKDKPSAFEVEEKILQNMTE